MVSTWTNHNHVHSMLGSYVSVLSDDQCSAAGLFLYRLLHSVQILPSLAFSSQKLATLLNAQHWEMCRSLMVVFNWYRDAGPRTVKSVLGIHREKGYEQLKSQSPMLADFIDHIVWFVYQEQKSWLEGKKADTQKKRKKNTRAIPLGPELHAPAPSVLGPLCSHFGPRPSALQQLPYNLYGLRSDKSRGKPVDLRPLDTFNGGQDELYARSDVLIQAIWTNELIVPALKPIDKTFSSTRRKTSDNDDVLNRCLTRGAILQCIADACGTDAIFASTSVKEFLASPSLVFHKQLHRDSVFAKRAVNDAITTLQPLFDWLTVHIEEHSEILEIAEQIGDLTHLNMLELSAGQSLLVEQARDPSQYTVIKAPVIPITGRRSRKQIFSEVTVASLVPNQDMVGIGVMGLIVREALAAQRELPATDEVLHRVLQGKHATRSTASSHNPDHTNPVRQYSLGANLLYHHLPGIKLTSEAGLSNLLSWLGTGQGFTTQSFLETLEPKGFYKDDVTAMINQFQSAVSTNWYLLDLRNKSDSDSGSKSKSQSAKIPELIVTHDARIWGQASNHLALLPTHGSGDRRGKKYTLDEKFKQYFTSVVGEEWTRALGDMLHQGPLQYTGVRRSWGYYHRMVKDLNIPGFQQGLTVFQLANYLVFLGIATMPHWTEIADFVAENRQKGAFRGLEKLGFHMPDSSSIRAAFFCVHRHLDEYLTDEDKKILGFSPLFTEHLLCKVVRWAKHLSTEGDINFYNKGLIAESAAGVWEAGCNQTDNTAFPFPLVINRENLEEAIKEAEVSIMLPSSCHKSQYSARFFIVDSCSRVIRPGCNDECWHFICRLYWKCNLFLCTVRLSAKCCLIGPKLDKNTWVRSGSRKPLMRRSRSRVG